MERRNDQCPICGRFISGRALRKAVDIRRENDVQRQVINDLIHEKGKASAREDALRNKNAELLREVADLRAELNRIKSRGLIERIINK